MEDFENLKEIIDKLITKTTLIEQLENENCNAKQNLKTPRNFLFISREKSLRITVKFQKKVPAKTRRGHLEGRRRRLVKTPAVLQSSKNRHSGCSRLLKRLSAPCLLLIVVVQTNKQQASTNTPTIVSAASHLIDKARV